MQVADIADMDFEEQGDALDGTALVGTMQIGPTLFHVNAIRVSDAEDPVHKEIRVQRPVGGDAELFGDLLNVYDERMQTVEIPGREGEWVLIIHPYGE